jgi:Reversibly glycosylated polypeptide
MSDKTAVVVAWHREEQIQTFLDEWHRYGGVKGADNWLVLQRDANGEGCARTKNKGIREAMRRGFEIVCVLDDDCLPHADHATTLEALMAAHAKALEPQKWSMFKSVTTPPSRGTPYNLPQYMNVAASMGFWTGIGDYDACAQLVRGATCPMEFHREIIYGRYFPLCGMNIAFKPALWRVEGEVSGARCQVSGGEAGPEAGAPFWTDFIDVPRFDDIWMGWLWQREAYRRGYCFNLNGPIVRHSRQSNVWQNLRDEAVHLERNETLWQEIAHCPSGDYESLRALLPAPVSGARCQVSGGEMAGKVPAPIAAAPREPDSERERERELRALARAFSSGAKC